jgi:hypothetical protein
MYDLLIAFVLVAPIQFHEDIRPLIEGPKQLEIPQEYVGEPIFTALERVAARCFLMAKEDDPIPPEMFKLSKCIQEEAVAMQILDEREKLYVLTRPEDIESDVRLLRCRWDELKDAPAIEDAFRFPERTVVNELLAFNRAYRHYVDIRASIIGPRQDQWIAAREEVDYLYQIWDTVRDSRCEYYYVTVRRQALKKLRDMLGEDNYYRGNLPPYVPIWRFQEIR